MIECSILLADFKILIRARHEYVVKQCEPYRTAEVLSPENADLTIEVSEEELEKERATAGKGFSAGYLESICVYRNICRRLPPLGGMLLHAAVISDGSHGYAFTADSGTGKTTHVRMWQKAFGDGIRIINGDKPILRKREGKWLAYGTPWCGKEGWNVNTAVPLAGICFLRRGETNHIHRYSTEKAVTEIMPQLLLPDDPCALVATLDLLDGVLTDIPLYELYCTVSEEAAHIARDAMTPASK